MSTFRLTLDTETAGVVEDALSYYLESSRDNFGSGYDSEDPDDVRQLLRERSLLVGVRGRIESAQARIDVRRG